MVAVVRDRPRLKCYAAALQRIRALAESCARQLTGWAGAVDKLPFEGRRHLPQRERATREIANKARDFRLHFLKTLKPSHPLYKSAEARSARGESRLIDLPSPICHLPFTWTVGAPMIRCRPSREWGAHNLCDFGETAL
jgi:hypothetical protein